VGRRGAQRAADRLGADACDYVGIPLHLPGAKTFLTVEPGRFAKVAMP
jgi:hypothetical protein